MASKWNADTQGDLKHNKVNQESIVRAVSPFGQFRSPTHSPAKSPTSEKRLPTILEQEEIKEAERLDKESKVESIDVSPNETPIVKATSVDLLNLDTDTRLDSKPNGHGIASSVLLLAKGADSGIDLSSPTNPTMPETMTATKAASSSSINSNRKVTPPHDDADAPTQAVRNRKSRTRVSFGMSCLTV